VSNVFGLPLKVKVGRQDIIFGNGWLVLDGTPLDGSRTIFFDAARATLDLKDANTSVDVIYIDQHAESDRWIKPFNDQDFLNIEQNERGAILYVTNKSLSKTQLDGYFIYKNDRKVLGTEPGDISAGNVAPWQAGSNADIYAFGARAAGDMDEHWKYRGEFAQELGRKNDVDLMAFGANTRLEYHLNDKLKNRFRTGYEFLSGDNPHTAQNEQFDPLWGRWPQFSELLAYTVALENRPGETTNLHRWNLGWTTTLSEKLELSADYNLLFAARKDSYGTRGYFTENSNFRGQLFSALLNYKFSSHISGHLLGEFFFPGDFYNESRNDVAAFLRYELCFTW
jgi:hypothetical protein